MTKEQMLAIIKAIQTNSLNDIKRFLDTHTDWPTILLENSKGHKIPIIHYASMNGKIDTVKLLLKRKPDLLNSRNDFNQTPICFAVVYGHLDLVRHLAKSGADLTIATHHPKHPDHKYLPVHWAALKGYLAIFQCLIDHHANINVLVKTMKYHLIHIASTAGHVEFVLFLLDKYPDLLNIKDDCNQTPVLWAASEGHLALVRHLTLLGADLTIATDCPEDKCHGYMPIHWAVSKGNHTIVEYFITYGVDLSIRIGAMQYHLIHIASIEGHLEVVQMLLKRDPSLLNIRDADGHTPLFLAAAYNHEHVVDYLITENANLDLAVSQPGNADHGQTPLDRAMSSGHYEAANLIILKMTANQSKEAILPYVQAGVQALDLMVLDPTLASIFLHDSRIMDLINQTNDHVCVTRQSIDWYKPMANPLKRRSSFFTQVNRDDGTVSVFKPVEGLGKGAYGTVRRFQRTNGQEEIAVKSLTERNVSACNRDELTRNLKREVEFNQRAYPEGNVSALFEFNTIENGEQHYTSRHLMPCVKGKTIRLLIPTITCLNQLAEMTLKIAQEVDRIHHLGIIHGDLNPDNIMIHCSENGIVTARLIDFGLSFNVTEENRKLWLKKNMGACMAPELGINNTPGQAVKPHPNQDVYTLGYSLNYLFKKSALDKKLRQAFPSIERFIVASQKENPMERPSLASFCEQLSNELNAKTTRSSIKQNILNMAMAPALMTYSWFTRSNPTKDPSPVPSKSKYCEMM